MLSAPYGEFTVESQRIPELGAGELLLNTELVGVCGTDTHIFKGEVPGIPYPVVLGHEFVGTIRALGEGVTRDTAGTPVKEGDRIVPMPATPCGTCPQCVLQPGPVVDCEAYDVVGFTDNTSRPLAGGLAEVVHLANPRTRFFKTNLPAKIAVLTEPFATPVHGVQRVGIKPGDTVLVQGSGTVGLLAVAAAISAGAARTIVVGGPRRRLDIAEAFGATETIDIDDVTDAAERIKLVKGATPNGLGVDVAIEAAGVPAAVVEGITCLRNGGRYCELGHFSDVGSVPINPYKHMLNNNITLVGSSGYSPLHFQQALRLLEAQRFPYESLVTHVLPLERSRDAVTALSVEGGWLIDGEVVGKVSVSPSG